MRLNSSAGPVEVPAGALDFIVNVPLEPQGVDRFVSGDVGLESYDLGCAKTIPLGSPLCCGCGCGDCCECGDCCGCADCCGCYCPAWDITWEGAVRYVSADWQRNMIGLNANGSVNTEAFNRMDFEGGGFRFGLGGRRYFGRCGMFSVFMNGDISLLLGHVQLSDQRTINTGSIPAQQISSRFANFRNIIPVTEIEAGFSGHMTANCTVSAGYMLSAWHDLGMRQVFNPDTDLSIQGYDDANILGFDGFFGRLETAF
jgi:hypothetical protein